MEKEAKRDNELRLDESADLEVTDISHILWGSDFPANQNFSGSLGVISRSLLSSQDRHLVSGGNISRLLQK